MLKGPLPQPMTYDRLRISWMAFLKLLDFGNSQEDAFKCPQCKETPKIIICDGITLGLQRRFLKKRARESYLHSRLAGLG